MIDSIPSLLFPAITLMISAIVLNLIQSSRRLQFLYILTQITAALSLELGLLLTNFEISDIAIHIILACSIVIMHFSSRLLQSIVGSDTINPYILEILVAGQRYEIQMGIFDLGKMSHPSLEHLDQIALDSSGELLETEYAEYRKLVMNQVMADYLDEPKLEFQIIQLHSRNRLYRQFVLVAYTLTLLEKNSHIEFRQRQTRNAVIQLQIQEHRFERIRLAEISYRKVQRAVALDSRGKLLVNPAKLLDGKDLKYFELGIHELDIFREIIDKQLQEAQNLDDFSNNSHYSHFIGKDFRDFPVYVPPVSSIIYFGTEYVTSLLNFSLFPDWIMISDDLASISEIRSQFRQQGANIRVIEYDQLNFDLVKMGIQYPKFFRLVLQLFEDILPADSKSGVRSIAAKICEFVELQNVLDDDQIDPSLSASDLVSSATYRKFSIDISHEVFAKLEPVLTLSLFNKSGKRLEQLWIKQGRDIIDVSSCTKLEKLSLLILIGVLHDQRIGSDKWSIIQLLGSDLQVDEVMSKLSQSIQFIDLMIQLQTVGSQLSWLRGIDLYLADYSMRNEKLRKYLFNPDTPERYLDLNYRSTKRTVLKRDR